jgi:hypothetical protein
MTEARSDALSPDGAALVRGLLARVQTGVLSTHSAFCAGYPFGSAAPFAPSPDGGVLFWFSELAEHTRNVRVDPRACLYVVDDGAQEREGAAGVARVALLGTVTPVDAGSQAEAESIYRARFPPLGAGPGLGGFSYWRLNIERVRWIAGFGRMGWLTWPVSMGQPG